jgi:hypothetical protein
MDAHSWYPRDYLERGIDRLKRGDVQWVTGPAVPRATSRWGATVAVALGTWLGRGGSTKWQSGGAAGDEEIELDTGVFGGIWRRETLERLGGWDEEFLVNEDAEMAARVISAAGRIVCLRTMGATYAPRDGLRALARQYCRFGMYRVRTSRRHPVALRRSHLLSAGLALTAGAAVSAPRPMRTAARTTMSAYATALLDVAAGTPADAGVRARLPVVLAVMHHAWGTGFIVGCARYGIPMAAIRRVLCASSAPTEPRPAGRGGR